MRVKHSSIPYWRLSGFYWFYFASLGALVPYWSLYLKELGYAAQQIGFLMAIIMATKIVSPNIWGWIADHTGKRMNIVRLGSLLAALSFIGVYASSVYWWLVVVMVVFSFFWNAALPQFEAITFNYLHQQTHRYSKIRLWGSIGFILTVMLLGPVLDRWGAGVLPHVLLFLFAGIWVSSLAVQERATGTSHGAHESLAKLLKTPAVLALLAVCLLMQMSHGPYYTFYTIYMEDQGYSRTLIGQLWGLGVFAEVLVFLWLPRLVPRIGLRLLLVSSLALACVRWWLVGYFAESLWIMVAAQVLHAATFGVYHASAIQLIHRYFIGRHQGRGQALYSSLSFGAGGAVGSFYSGLTWDSLGPQVTFAIAAVIAFVAMLVAWVWIPKAEPDEKPAVHSS
ncbi:MAG: MFS transporter [Gammaproteobacteria bacterium]|jgi:PPP family 3-phenylpropionic acid transporter|nr:MFS transporter [Gammaproteobacteria bacterium]